VLVTNVIGIVEMPLRILFSSKFCRTRAEWPEPWKCVLWRMGLPRL